MVGQSALADLSMPRPQLGCPRRGQIAYAVVVIKSGPGNRVRQPGMDTQGASRLRAGMWSVRRQRSVRAPARRRPEVSLPHTSREEDP